MLQFLLSIMYFTLFCWKKITIMNFKQLFSGYPGLPGLQGPRGNDGLSGIDGLKGEMGM